MLAGLLLLGFVLEMYKFHILGLSAWWLLAFGLLILGLVYVRGKHFFAYDSDGEALNFKNSHLFGFFSKPASDEFPKYKLQNFEIVDAVIFRRLYIMVDSKKHNATTLRYDISYLTKKEVSDLKMSLSRVVKANKEKKR